MFLKNLLKRKRNNRNNSYNDVTVGESLTASDFLENSDVADVIRHESAVGSPEFANAEFAGDYANGINGGVTENAPYHNTSDYKMIAPNEPAADYQSS